MAAPAWAAGAANWREMSVGGMLGLVWMFVYVIAMPVRSGPRAGPGSSCRGGGPCSPPSSHCGDPEERELGARNRPKRPKIPRVRLGDVCGGLGCINCHRHGVAILRFNTRSSTRFSRALVSCRFWGGGGVFFFFIYGERCIY